MGLKSLSLSFLHSLDLVPLLKLFVPTLVELVKPSGLMNWPSATYGVMLSVECFPLLASQASLLIVIFLGIQIRNLK